MNVAVELLQILVSVIDAKLGSALLCAMTKPSTEELDCYRYLTVLL